MVGVRGGKEMGKSTYESLPADGLDEAVHDFGDELGADACAADFGWVTVHARLPDRALARHGGDGVCSALVRFVLQ